VGLAVLLIVLLAVLDWQANALRGPISRTLSARMHRPVSIKGHLDLHLLSWHPYALFNDIAVANPAWAGQGDMARIGKLAVQMSVLPLLRGVVVLPRLEVDDARVDLLRDASDRANWRFNPSGESTKKTPARLPIVRSFSLRGARFNYRDDLRKLTLSSTISASEPRAGKARSWARLRGHGEANGEPFTLAVNGQPLQGVRPDKPYVATFAVRAADTRLDGEVSTARAFDLGSLRCRFRASGQDLADLYHITGLALPNTSPYHLTATLRREGTKVQASDVDGKIGSSDLRGMVSLETAHKRPFMTADLRSQTLKLSDVAASFGARIPGARTPEAGAKPSNTLAAKAARTGKHAGNPAAPLPGHELLLPDAPLDLQRVRGMDADVRYSAGSVQAKKLPLREVALHLRLDHGVLSIEPASFVLKQGRVAGRARMDATHEVPKVALDMRLTDVRLAQFRPKSGPPPLEGTMVGRALLEGSGASVHKVASTLDGTAVAVVPRGEIRAAFAELTGINIARGLGLLLTKSQQHEDVRCGVAQFQAVKGTLVARSLVFDTQDVLITGKGNIDLGTEQLDLTLNGQPKKLRLVRVRSPIEIGGTLLHPAFGLKPGNTVAQGTAAVALGTLLTPVAAVLAFIDPGLAKDADCSALLHQGRQEGAPLKTASASPDAAGAQAGSESKRSSANGNQAPPQHR